MLWRNLRKFFSNIVAVVPTNEITTNNSFAYINKKMNLERLANRGDLCNIVRKAAC
jgi:hypothetical protein